MITKREFDQVDMACFKEIKDKGPREKKQLRKTTKLLPDEDNDYQLSGPSPPSSCQPVSSMTLSGQILTGIELLVS